MTQLSLDRILQLADPGTFTPYDPVEASGFHLGSIKVNGRPVYVLASDVDQPMRILPQAAFARQVAFLESIFKKPAPLVQLLDVPALLKKIKGKTLVPPGALGLLASSKGVGRVYALLGRLEGVVPRASVVLGPLGASHSFPATFSDVTIMLEDSAMCIGRPEAVTLMTGQKTSFQNLGGAHLHYTETGNAHMVVKTEAGALTWTKQWLSYWPDHAKASLPSAKPISPTGDMQTIGKNIEQLGLNAPFDMHDFIKPLVDGGSWIETGAAHAGECLTGLCRINGHPLAIVAGNSNIRGGILFPETCRKLTRFIHLCGKFGLPVAFLADTPGFMVGEEVERHGNVKAASDLYTAIAKSPSDKVCIVVRKAYSAGLYAMAGGGFDAKFWAMPQASISIMGPDAIERFNRDDTIPQPMREAAEEMLKGALDPEILVSQELVDEVIPWELLRDRLMNFADISK